MSEESKGKIRGYNKVHFKVSFSLRRSTYFLSKKIIFRCVMVTQYNTGRVDSSDDYLLICKTKALLAFNLLKPVKLSNGDHYRFNINVSYNKD